MNTVQLKESELKSIVLLDIGIMHLTTNGAVMAHYSKENVFMLINLAKRNKDIKFIQEGEDEEENN